MRIHPSQSRFLRLASLSIMELFDRVGPCSTVQGRPSRLAGVIHDAPIITQAAGRRTNVNDSSAYWAFSPPWYRIHYPALPRPAFVEGQVGCDDSWRLTSRASTQLAAMSSSHASQRRSRRRAHSPGAGAVPAAWNDESGAAGAPTPGDARKFNQFNQARGL